MRFRRLELVRYGGFADRVLSFGEGRPDLHLIVGPNEAGKSTLLSAIADLLFGFPGQSAQDWRYDYKDLRLRALLEDGGDSLDVVRRKGNRNTLLGPDGSTLKDDALTPFVGGHDRATFERMFGLDHAKLRAGGQAILDGRDEAARALFQAGSGLGVVGTQLKALDAKAAALFKPSASNPTVNALLKQRGDQLKRVRETTLGEAELTAVRQRQAEATAKRDALIAEAEALSARANAVERVLRTRAPLGRLAAARDELERIGPTPHLPEAAQRVLAGARAERATARELLGRHREEATRASEFVADTVLPQRLLAERARIEALDERRPAIEKGQADLARRLAELEDVEARFAAARTGAGFKPSAPLPGESWQRRAARHLEAVRALDAGAAKLAADASAAAAERRDLDGKLALTQLPADPAALRTAVADMPADAEDRLRKAQRVAERAHVRVETGPNALRWSASAQALTVAPLPSAAEVAALARLFERIADERQRSLSEAEAARREAAEQRRRLGKLTAGSTLPTPEAIRAVRDRRTTALRDLRSRFAAPRRADDASAIDALAELIGQADDLADRRDADSKRIAEAAVATAALEEASSRGEMADAALARWAAEAEAAEAAWARAVVGLPSGLRGDLRPAGFEAWRAERERVLKDVAEAGELAVAAADLRAHLDGAHGRLGLALLAMDATAPEDYVGRLGQGRATLARLEEALRRRERLETRREVLEGRVDELARERHMTEAQCDRLVEAGRALGAEGGVEPRSEALERAVEEGGVLAADAVRRTGLQRQIEGIGKDLGLFADDVAACLVALKRPPSASASTDVVRALAHDLTAALELTRTVALRAGEAERAEAEVRLAERRIATAQREIAALEEAAGVADEADLDAALAAAMAAAAAKAREVDALRDLAESGEGRGVEVLMVEAEALPPDQAAGERDALAMRRREIEAEREDVGRSLAEVQGELDRMARQSLAAEARQEVAETQTALAAAAERYVEVSAGAALLRWLIERHRASSQAPLLAQAGSLFAQVTEGAFTGLALDYGDDDRARIVAARADSSRVGVEGLSEGTRDQLFLALRLGALQLATTAPGRAAVLPLVCDDLLITADDARAAAMLGVLRAASQTLQILVFTHHEHLVEVASRAIGADGFVLHRLEPVQWAAA